jgi:DNA-nicking Smr family endonuclease
MTGRSPSREERALWRAAMRDVAPLAEGAPLAASETPAPPAEEPSRPRPRAALKGAGLDRRSAQRLARGQRPIEARLDLHGMTQDEAHRALGAFIRGAAAAERRTLLVITGKGGLGGGVLRDAVPRWLGEAPLRAEVLALAPAQPKDGGLGALYVLLRRRR